MWTGSWPCSHWPTDSGASPASLSLSLCASRAHLQHNWRKCKVFRISCCNETPGWMKESSVGLWEGSSCVMPVSGHMTQSDGEAVGHLRAHEQVQHVWCAMRWGVRGIHIECRCAVRNWSGGQVYKMWIVKIRGFDENQKRLWLRCKACMNTHTHLNHRCFLHLGLLLVANHRSIYLSIYL